MADIDLDTTITGVTVYPDRALVTRGGETTLDAPGEHSLRIGGLPLGLQRDSLRATGRGPTGMRILGVEQSLEFHAVVPDEVRRGLEQEIERLEQELAMLDERTAVFEQQQSWLRSLAEHSARSLAWSLAHGTTKPDDVSSLFAYTGEESQRVAASRLEVKRQRDITLRDLEARRRELAQLSGPSPDRIAATIRVELAEPGTVAVELSYLVAGASWRPRYDARVDVPRAAVHLLQQALVTQRTGEEWAAVDLALSTARPAVARRLPDDPAPWYVDAHQPAVAMGVAESTATPIMARVAHGALQRERGITAMQPAAGYALAAPASVEADLAAAEVEQSGAAQLFRLPGQIDIPADGQPHTLAIGEYDLPCRLDYVAMPAVAEGAHLRARAPNTTGLILLPGDLHVFRAAATGDEYAGASRLELTAEHADLTLYLGVDDNVSVKRELVERDTDKGSLLQGGIRRITFGYRVTLANRTATLQPVVLKDRLPVPRHERVKLKVLDIRPQPTDRTRLEQLTWELQLAPNEERRIEWRFVVEAPADMEVIGLP
jgi:uncharacterized protein (TIGR02231 family)